MRSKESHSSKAPKWLSWVRKKRRRDEVYLGCRVMLKDQTKETEKELTPTKQSLIKSTLLLSLAVKRRNITITRKR